MADLPSDETVEVIVRAGSTSSNEMEVNTDGSINVSDVTDNLVLQKKVYQVCFEVNLASSGEKMMVLIKNPSGSGKLFRPISYSLGLTNTVGSMAIIRLYANPTVTANGTPATVRPAYIGASPAQGASAMLVYTVPTVTANGDLYGAVQINGGTGGSGSPTFSPQNLVLNENNAFLFTGNPDGTNRNVLFTLKWTEV